MNKINHISPQDSKFLQRVSVIDKPANNIWFIGNISEDWSDRPTVAIVGSRKPTDYGRSVTLQLSATLAEKGVIIVSGLALGHDALAARGALDAGGITVAVIGNGLNRIHPRSNEVLSQQIIEQGGAIISEYEPDYPVYRSNFLQRNRLIAALSDIIIIVEAGERSGTLNTAAHALAQNKELMAVPGNITSPLSLGCNRLIAQGAEPVLSADDVLEKLRSLYSTNHKDKAESFLENFSDKPVKDTSNLIGNNETESKILEVIANGVIDGDEIIRSTKLSASDYSIAITMLEINGQIRALGANRWTIK